MVGRIGVIAVWSDAAPHLAATIATLNRAGIEHTVIPPAPDDAAVARARSARVHIVGGFPVGRALLAMLDNAELLVRAGVGVDRIDITAAEELGIVVTNTPDYCVGEVADHTIMLLLAGWRGLPALQRQIGGSWQAVRYPPSPRLQGRTLGIVGLGRIGTAVAARASALRLRIIAADPYCGERRFAAARATATSFDELLAESDVISLHLPLTAQTHHLLDDRAFGVMARQPLIVNASRGELVDSAALADALDAERVRGACLDVLESEPEVAEVMRRLDRENVIVTPRSAWYSDGAVEQLGTVAAQTALQFLSTGTVDRPLNPEVLGRTAVRPVKERR